MGSIIIKRNYGSPVKQPVLVEEPIISKPVIEEKQVEELTPKVSKKTKKTEG